MAGVSHSELLPTQEELDWLLNTQHAFAKHYKRESFDLVVLGVLKHGMPLRVIADALGVTRPSVDQRLQRALRMIRYRRQGEI